MDIERLPRFPSRSKNGEVLAFAPLPTGTTRTRKDFSNEDFVGYDGLRSRSRPKALADHRGERDFRLLRHPGGLTNHLTDRILVQVNGEVNA